MGKSHHEDTTFPIEEPSVSCEGTCFIVKGKIGNWNDDVEIVSISQSTQKLTDGEPLEDSPANIPPDQVNPYLLLALRDYFGVSTAVGAPPGGEFVDQWGECDEYCYCEIPENARSRNPSREPVIYDVTLSYLSIRWVSNFLKPNNPNLPLGEPGWADSSGQPFQHNPLTDALGKAVQGPMGGFRFPLETRFLASVKLRATVELSERWGECKPIPSSDQELHPV